MSSRELILKKIKSVTMENGPLPELPNYPASSALLMDFSSSIERIGGKVILIDDWQALEHHVRGEYGSLMRVISTISESAYYVSKLPEDPHELESVDLAILRGHFGVAENGAIWITDDQMGDRSLPFISQHLALLVNRNDIVPTLQEAYEKIELLSYNFGTFIAGPSKTADIEQSLVLGAHGPKSLVVFLM